MAPEASILHFKPFCFLLLLLLPISSSSAAAAAATSSSTTSFNIEISGEHSADPSSAAAAPAPATPNIRISASFSFTGPAPPPTAAPSASAAAAAAADAAASEAMEMEKLLGDAAARLALRGPYLVASGALRAHRDELTLLHKMTVLAPDDRSIADSLYYDSPPRFHLHVVPDRLLTDADLRRLPVGSELPTLDPRESLVVTSSGAGGSDFVQLNFVGVKAPDLITNSRIAVHGVHLPISELEL